MRRLVPDVLSSALMFISFIVVFWCMSAGASSARGWLAWLITISVVAVSVVMAFGCGSRVLLPCRLIVHFWGCGSTRISCTRSRPPCFQSHVPAAMLACDKGLFFLRHGGAGTDKGQDPLHTGMVSSLLHIDTLDVGSFGVSSVFCVCGLGLKKCVKDLCQLRGIIACPSQVGIVAVTAAAFVCPCVVSVATAFASVLWQPCAAAAASAGAFVYILMYMCGSPPILLLQPFQLDGVRSILVVSVVTESVFVHWLCLAGFWRGSSTGCALQAWSL